MFILNPALTGTIVNAGTEAAFVGCVMSQVPNIGVRHVVRFAFAGLAAALLAGCADASRFAGDPLGNPFKSASNTPAPRGDDMAPPPPYSPTRGAVRSRSLMPPADASPRNVATYEAPSHPNQRLASDYRAPRTERTASIPASSGHGSWTGEGGMSVVAGSGDSARIIADRYNVPTDALLHANGLASASEIRPGTRLTIPVYNANGSASSRVAQVEPPHREPVHRDHSSREKLLAKRDTKQDVARREQAEKDAKLARYEKAERDAKLARAEAAKEAARRQVAERDNDRREDAKNDKMNWVKGPQPAKIAKTEKPEKGRGREKALAKLERHKAESQVADARTPEAPEPKPSRKPAKVEVVHDAPVKVAKAEVEETRKAPTPVDPTPTASLPPAAVEKASVSSGGNPEFRWPAHGRIIQGFKSGGNDGINIAVPEGTAVKAAESGTVAYAGSEIKGFGNLVLIRHPNGFVSAYANNGDIEVKRGEQVKRGQTIAKSGQSGNVASPQLHFELRKGSTPVDPTRYLAGL